MKINDIESKGVENSGHILHDYNMRKDTFKHKKLARKYIEELLTKLEIPNNTIAQCLKAPVSAYGKVMNISHLIVNGKLGYGKLADLRDLLCDELKVIPERLRDPKIFNNVRNFMNQHVKILTR